MGVEVPFMMRAAVSGRLMKSHRIREGHVKNLVVGRRHLLQQLGQQDDFSLGKIPERSQMAAAAHHDFEGPDRPEGH